MAVKIKRRTPGPTPKFDWAVVRDDFIRTNMTNRDGKLYTLEACAAKWGMSYGRLRMVAAKENWIDQIKETKANIVNRSLDLARDTAVFDEVEVRTRQATYAKLAQEKAIAKLQAIKPETLSVRDATFLLQLGFISERKALGLPEQFSVDLNPTNIISRAHEIFERRLNSNSNVEKALAAALKIIDVDSERVSDDGIGLPAVR